MDAETRLLLDITFLTAIAGVCSIFLAKLKFPPIIGYLVAGIVLGPAVLPQLSVEESTVHLLSSMGIVLLMFYIGLELNLRELRKMGSFTISVVTINMTTMVVAGYLTG
jgi:CPA2 family monovalent cation:H+ antiporter-2